MRATCCENLLAFHSRHLAASDLASRNPLVVLAVGPEANDPFLRQLFTDHETTDLRTATMPMAQRPLPHSDGSFDVVICVDGLQRSTDLGIAFDELVRVTRADGLLCVVAPSAGSFAGAEYVRVSPEVFGPLARRAGVETLDLWQDERGPGRNVVGVFSQTNRAPSTTGHNSVALATAANTPDPAWDDATNVTTGARPYLEVLAELHVALEPRLYLEIGVRNGRSLALARGAAIGVDPIVDITVPLPPAARIVEITSDEFFADHAARELAEPPGLVFIDGMHLIEFVLRDFMNTEANASDSTVVVIDDVAPNHPDQATRRRKSRIWTGDVWKIRPILEKYRPDLELTLLDTHPSGLLVISGLDPKNRTLWDHYDEVVAFALDDLSDPPLGVIERRRSHPVEGPSYAGFLDELAGRGTPELSVIVVAYNMARELPRTLHTLCSDVQGLPPESYEIIVVDNGSSTPLDERQLQSIAANVTLLTIEDPTVSPAPAVNEALAIARGQVIGVLIDGARMASPGLLRQALAVTRLEERAVVGTFGFHLGNKQQSLALAEGYDQTVEDELLECVPWRDDGYSLFDISVFAASSAEGWFVTPAETNALFTTRALWDELGGLDEHFVSPGGGIVNHDTWQRACELPGTEVFMLLGEGTFHQFHGGVATNSPVSRWPEFAAEYEAIRSVPYVVKNPPVTYYGQWREPRGAARGDSA